MKILVIGERVPTSYKGITQDGDPGAIAIISHECNDAKYGPQFHNCACIKTFSCMEANVRFNSVVEVIETDSIDLKLLAPKLSKSSGGNWNTMYVYWKLIQSQKIAEMFPVGTRLRRTSMWIYPEVKPDKTPEKAVPVWGYITPYNAPAGINNHEVIEKYNGNVYIPFSCEKMSVQMMPGKYVSLNLGATRATKYLYSKEARSLPYDTKLQTLSREPYSVIMDINGTAMKIIVRDMDSFRPSVDDK